MLSKSITHLEIAKSMPTLKKRVTHCFNYIKKELASREKACLEQGRVKYGQFN